MGVAVGAGVLVGVVQGRIGQGVDVRREQDHGNHGTDHSDSEKYSTGSWDLSQMGKGSARLDCALLDWCYNSPVIGGFQLQSSGSSESLCTLFVRRIARWLHRHVHGCPCLGLALPSYSGLVGTAASQLRDPATLHI